MRVMWVQAPAAVGGRQVHRQVAQPPGAGGEQVLPPRRRCAPLARPRLLLLSEVYQAED